jgi:hypothetical protein
MMNSTSGEQQLLSPTDQQIQQGTGPQPSDEDQIQFVVEQVNHILGRHYSLVE